jgi:hypothetical protein
VCFIIKKKVGKYCGLFQTSEFSDDALTLSRVLDKEAERRYGSASASCLAAGKSVSSVGRVAVTPSHLSSVFSFYFLRQWYGGKMFFGSCRCFQFRDNRHEHRILPGDYSSKIVSLNFRRKLYIVFSLHETASLPYLTRKDNAGSLIPCSILGSHSGSYEEFYLLGYNAM